MNKITIPFTVMFAGEAQIERKPGESLQELTARFIEQLDIEAAELCYVDDSAILDEEGFDIKLENEYRSILGVSADKPEELRSTDVFRVLDEAKERGWLLEFGQWLFDQEISQQVRDEMLHYQKIFDIKELLKRECSGVEEWNTLWNGCDVEEWIEDCLGEGQESSILEKFKVRLAKAREDWDKAVYEARHNL